MAAARVRRAFKYPAEDDTEPVEGIDEDEQDQIIASIARQDVTNSVVYKYVFLAFPIVCAVAYLPALTSPASTRTSVNACFCISSLACSAWILLSHPTSPDPGARVERSYQNRRTLKDQFLDPGLTQWYLPILTGTQGFVLAFQSLVVKSRDALWPPGWLPMVVFGLVMLAREWLRPIDVKELERSRYRYKGA